MMNLAMVNQLDVEQDARKRSCLLERNFLENTPHFSGMNHDRFVTLHILFANGYGVELVRQTAKSDERRKLT